MPFRSEAQRKYMYARMPDLAKKWQAKYGDPKRLPEYVGKRKKLSRKS